MKIMQCPQPPFLINKVPVPFTDSASGHIMYEKKKKREKCNFDIVLCWQRIRNDFCTIYFKLALFTEVPAFFKDSKFYVSLVKSTKTLNLVKLTKTQKNKENIFYRNNLLNHAKIFLKNLLKELVLHNNGQNLKYCIFPFFSLSGIIQNRDFLSLTYVYI